MILMLFFSFAGRHTKTKMARDLLLICLLLLRNQYGGRNQRRRRSEIRIGGSHHASLLKTDFYRGNELFSLSLFVWKTRFREDNGVAKWCHSLKFVVAVVVVWSCN